MLEKSRADGGAVWHSLPDSRLMLGAGVVTGYSNLLQRQKNLSSINIFLTLTVVNTFIL